VALEPSRDRGDTVADVIDAVLDKGLVINADIMVSLAGVELLGVKVRAALASFETAARYGLEFPSGTNLDTVAWREAALEKERCPGCGERFAGRAELLDTGCPACGWRSSHARGLSPETPAPIVAR
jgi:gas vesicle structural protein